MNEKTTPEQRDPKTVFILGAGFSVPAGVPQQDQLLSKVVEQQIQRKVYPWLSDVDQPEIEKVSVLRFMKQVYGLSEDQLAHFALEDFFTPVHQCLSDGEFLKTFPNGRLRLVQRNLTYLLAHAINHGHDLNREGYIRTFSQKICTHLKDNKPEEPCSVISLNWDIVLDRISFEETGTLGCLDYCCHCEEIDDNNSIESGSEARENDKYVFKLLKIHGSLNWARCPSCERLYINKNEKAGISALAGDCKCKVCRNSKLTHSILLPSFRKDFSKKHYQNIWNQTAVELSEATRIVFIGYSFPLADFDFRSLITKHVGNVIVDVVLWDPERKPFKNYEGYVRPNAGDKNDPNTEDGNRYLSYFGDKIDHIYYGGVEDWVENHMDETLYLRQTPNQTLPLELLL